MGRPQEPPSYLAPFHPFQAIDLRSNDQCATGHAWTEILKRPAKLVTTHCGLLATPSGQRSMATRWLAPPPHCLFLDDILVVSRLKDCATRFHLCALGAAGHRPSRRRGTALRISTHSGAQRSTPITQLYSFLRKAVRLPLQDPQRLCAAT